MKIFSLLLSSLILLISPNPAVIRAGHSVCLPPLPEIKGIVITSSPIFDIQGNILGATIPLKRAGKLFFMEGTVNDVTGNFILDTGASGLVLNKTYFRNSIVVEDEEAGGVTGSIVAIERLHVKKMTVSDLIYSGLPADVAPLGHLENRRGIKILGLFGMNLLQDAGIVFDFRHNEMRVYKLDRNGNCPGQSGIPDRFDIVRKLKIIKNVVFIKATMGGKELDFCLDTGAESNLLNTGIPQPAMNSITITRRSTLRGSGSGQGEILMGMINEFTLGDKQLGPMETALCNLHPMAGKYGFNLDGMLGYDFFMKGRFYLNLVKKEMGINLAKEEKQ